jgi:hypothetical protein
VSTDLSASTALDDRGEGSQQRVAIPLHAAARTRALFVIFSIAFTVGSAIWIGLSPSWGSIVYGGLLIVVFSWLWLTRMAARRARRGEPLQLVATSDGVSSFLWSLDWNRVAGIWIGPTAAGGVEALHIEPIRTEDIRWKTPSKILRVNARLGGTMNMAPLQIPRANVDRPLEDIASDLERLARRPLRRDPPV